MKKYTLSFLLVFFTTNLFSFAYPYEKMELLKDLVKNTRSLEIIKQTPLKQEDKIFAESYWKIFYQKDKIVGEELYQQGKLVYYYIYYYTKEKIFQKGFFWQGIYTKPFSVKLSGQDIKQGFIYKNIPDSYRVYDSKTLQLTYSYIYPQKEI